MLPIPRSFAPMEAVLVDELPTGDEWQYEPKWDGFRCLVFRDGYKVELMSKGESRWRATSPMSWSWCAGCVRRASCSTARSWFRRETR